MLLRSSRNAQALQKEAFVGTVGKFLAGRGVRSAAGVASKKPGLLKRVGADFTSGLAKARETANAMPAVGPLMKGQARGTLANWAPKTMVGKGAKIVAQNPMASLGVAAGTGVAGGAVVEQAQKSYQNATDPYALERRRMSGFRS